MRTLTQISGLRLKWLSDWLIEELNDYVIKQLSEWLIDWVSNKWVNELKRGSE